MSKYFLDNQSVNAAAINQIAIDLGKSTFSAFTDGTPFSVDKLNEITQAITSAGIVLGDTNNCKTELSNGQISVDTGLCIFHSGAKKRIEQKQYLTPTANTKQYIYLLNDASLNTINLKMGTENPADTENADYVMLATYGEDNTLTDQRTFSTAKVSINSANQYQTCTLESVSFWSSEDFKNRYYIGDYGKPFQYAMSLYRSTSGVWTKINSGNVLRVGEPYSSPCMIKVESDGTKLYYRKEMSGRGGITESFQLLFL